MAAKQAQFDLARLSRSIVHERSARDLTWSQISKDVGVAVSTIRRFETAADAEADGVLQLIGWLGAAPEDFVADSTVAGALLPATGDGVIRVDMALVADLTTSPRRAKTGTRTTIQRLTDAAQASGVTMASLTRWSPT